MAERERRNEWLVLVAVMVPRLAPLSQPFLQGGELLVRSCPYGRSYLKDTGASRRSMAERMAATTRSFRTKESPPTTGTAAVEDSVRNTSVTRPAPPQWPRS
jgi:hypothetical protein